MEPAVKPAALHSKSRVIGIIATANTLQGRLFRETSARFAANAKIIPAVGEGFVELVENGEQNTDRARAVVSKVVEPLVAKGADHIVLGCTHYSFLKELIAEIAGPSVTIVDPAIPVARRAATLISQAN